MKSSFFKTLFGLSLFTIVMFFLSFTFSTFAGEGPYPRSVLTKLQARLNGELKKVDLVKVWPDHSIQEIQIEARSADVDVMISNTPEIKIQLQGTADAQQALTVEAEDGVLKVKVNGGSVVHWNFFSGLSVETERELRLQVLVPEAYKKELNLESGSGDIKVLGPALQNVDIKTASGDLKISGSIASLKVRTASGDVDIKDLVSESMHGASASGNFNLENVKVMKAHFQTASGSIEARLESLDPWTIRAQTASGDIDGDLIEGEVHNSEIKIGKGAQEIDIQTASGDIRLRK